MLTDRRYIRRRILIVSSCQDSANSLAGLLRAEGHYVAIANDGQSALEWNLDFQPDIVLLNLRLTGTDAYALAQSMRVQRDRENVTMVCVTEWLREADAPVPWKETGFSYHLQVPADEGDLEVMFGLLGIPEDPSWTDNRYSSRRILIAEHDREAAESLATQLRQMGNQVEIVHDPCAALEAERSFRPDIVLIDVCLPGMDPRTFTQSLRWHPSLRMVSLDGLWSVGCGREAMKAKREGGFDSLLRIPADLIDLQLHLVYLGVATESAADAANSVTRSHNNRRGVLPQITFRRLILSAAKHDPAEMVTAMTARWDASANGQSLEEFLEQMRTWTTEDPPSDPSQIPDPLQIWESLWRNRKAEEIPMLRQDAYEGWWRWYRYFHG